MYPTGEEPSSYMASEQHPGAACSRNGSSEDLQDLPVVKAMAAMPAPWVWFYRQRLLPCRKRAAAWDFETKLKKGFLEYSSLPMSLN